ncbi:MAG: four helix bundle protein [Bdellovibrionota bacterium]
MIQNFQAYELALQLYRKVEVIELKHHLKDQLMRASQSVVLNLAEGSAKPTWKDKTRFYAIAFGSIREVQAVFDLISLEDAETLKLTDRIAGCLYRLTYRNRPPHR